MAFLCFVAGILRETQQCVEPRESFIPSLHNDVIYNVRICLHTHY